jgi:hypothetical protein
MYNCCRAEQNYITSDGQSACLGVEPNLGHTIVTVFITRTYEITSRFLDTDTCRLLLCGMFPHHSVRDHEPEINKRCP